MSESKSALMLKYQKAKVKLKEYAVPEEEYPHYPLNYKDLAFPTVLVISKYAESVNSGIVDCGLYERLRICSEYYDAALKSREQTIHDADFALTGAAAYFFTNNYGSAKVLWEFISEDTIMDKSQACLYDIFSLVFSGKTNRYTEAGLIRALVCFWKNGNRDELNLAIKEYDEQIHSGYSVQGWFFGDITCAVVRIIAENAARILLPTYSECNLDVWKEYFDSKNAINLLWPSQKLIGEKGILRGENAIVQLPTGVGKTKSIEIIIWSMFLTERGSKAIIVAPLRSLCNEITHDLSQAFSKNVIINQFSDVLDDDYQNVLLGENEKQILICTPEKLQYIIHHDEALLGGLDLFIFDESHMFDDTKRGAMYELLLTNIKTEVSDNKQLILMSAVLPNAKQLVNWTLGNDGVLAYDKNIISTPKAVGFLDKNSQLHYYLGKDQNEDFYVPHTIQTSLLQLHGKERKKRSFPENARDVALYYANILCQSGGVAIYFDQARSIPVFFDRINDLSKRKYSLSRIIDNADEDELRRFRKLYYAYYGENSTYCQTVCYGILPHYSSLPNGIKLATEYAFRNRLINVVACTSTLAQGVNIPIKYLLITSTNYTANKMSVRNFQNLIGRTARSGVYTNGDIIVTSCDVYDNRNQKRGVHKWKTTRKLFDSEAIEACGSAILNIVQDFEVCHKYTFSGESIVNYICEKIQAKWDGELINDIAQQLLDNDECIDEAVYRREIEERIHGYRAVVTAIENELAYRIAKTEVQDNTDLQTIWGSLLEESLAYYLADEKKKNLLGQLFKSIADKIYLRMDDVRIYSKCMIPIEVVDRIAAWINEMKINSNKRTNDELLVLIEGLFEELYPQYHLKKGLAFLWIKGESYSKMCDKLKLKMREVERGIQYNLAFQMSFLVGNVIDIVNDECINEDSLQLIQLKLRYGVDSQTAISICEKVFNDRYLATKITDILGNTEVTTKDIVAVIKSKKNEVIALLSEFPSYFSNRIESL